MTACYTQNFVCECDASCKRELALDNSRSPVFMTQWQTHDRNDLQIVKPENDATVRPNELLARLEMDDLDVILREKRLLWFGHFERSSGAIRQIEGKQGPGRPKKTWRTLTERDRREWKINKVDPCDRYVWRSSMSLVQLASYLEGSPLV